MYTNLIALSRRETATLVLPDGHSIELEINKNNSNN